MLCVRRLTLIDRVELSSLWTHDLKKQWNYADPVAVRVSDVNEQALGSTIPAPFMTGWGNDRPTVRASWIDQDPVEITSADDEKPNLIACKAPVADANGSASGSAPVPRDTSVSPANSHSVTQSPHQTSVSEDRDGGDSAARPDAQDVSTPGAPPTHAEVKGLENVPAPPSESGCAVGGTPTAGTSLNLSPLSAPIEEASNRAQGSAPLGGVGVNGAHTPPTASSAERRPSFSSCIPINISQVPNGVVNFQVITVFGVKVAVAQASVRAALESKGSESASVRHYAVIVTPAKSSVSSSTIHGVLEFSVVSGTTDIDAVAALSASADYSSMPVSLLAGHCCAFSTQRLYFPSRFLTGNGVYIVSNVLCVESHSDNPVRLEMVVPENLKSMRVLPERKAVLKTRGDRAYFTCTWDVFSTSVVSTSENHEYSEQAVAGLHVLIRDGAENRAPVDLAVSGESPRADTEDLGPYMFFVNHALITNISCNATDAAILADILPISLVTRAGV